MFADILFGNCSAPLVNGRLKPQWGSRPLLFPLGINRCGLFRSFSGFAVLPVIRSAESGFVFPTPERVMTRPSKNMHVSIAHNPLTTPLTL